MGWVTFCDSVSELNLTQSHFSIFLKPNFLFKLHRTVHATTLGLILGDWALDVHWTLRASSTWSHWTLGRMALHCHWEKSVFLI